MPIRDFRFLDYNGYRPALAIRIKNPDGPEFFDTIGLIDTGADACAIPATFAPILGHNLEKGSVTTVSTGNGDAIAYRHKTIIELKNEHGESLFEIRRKIDYIEGLNFVLLGVRGFLGHHLLQINYPALRFSIIAPDIPRGI